MSLFPRLAFLALTLSGVHAQSVNVTVQAGLSGKPVSPDLIGVFFEDLNYAADGGLYAELVQNRSFEYSASEQTNWGPLTGWEFVKRGNGGGELWIDDSGPIHPNNQHSAIIQITEAGEGVGLVNTGFDGINVIAGETYDFSVFTRLLNVGGRRDSKPVGRLPLGVRLETQKGDVIAEANVEASSPADWKQLTATLTVTQSATDARLVVLAKGSGLIALDEISLFPTKTFRGRKNGLRSDLAQAVADLKPKFMRFPGGCLVHGDGISNIYHWKDTIGPVEQRKSQRNIWRYHQSVGLGYFEYFQFCDDIGAMPLPVVAAGVSCQNSTRTRGTGQQAIPMSDMPAYVQDVLDLVEYANGPATTTWGAKRAAAGHPAPFGLKYLGVGNEDHITPEFAERFKLIFETLKAKHPEITVIGTVGPSSDGDDFARGWKLAGGLGVSMVDEHYYKTTQWFWDNLGRYDNYDRAKSKVYLGEYAAHDDKRRNTLRSALAEAAYLTSLERNADVVPFASYAPLLARRGHTQWSPDMIYFTGTDLGLTINYHVQQLFSLNNGDTWLATEVSPFAAPARFAASTLRDGHTGDLILKFVNGDAAAKPLRINLAGIENLSTSAVKTTLAASDADTIDAQAVRPRTSSITVAPTFDYEAPANSLTIIRIKTR